MASEITMPQLSDTMTEGTVVKWHKKEGDAVKAGEEIADIETDKATMPMEAFDAGTLAYIAASEGAKVKVGDLLAVIAAPGESAEDVRKHAREGARQPSPPASADIETDHPKIEEQRAAQSEKLAAPGTQPPQEKAGPDVEARLRVSPLARRLAADKGIDLSQVKGSGPGGRIVERDVLEFTRRQGAPSGTAAPAQPKASPVVSPILLTGQKQVIPLTKMRSAIAVALLRSKQSIPHYYETIDVDLERIVSLRKQLNERLEKEGIRLSILDFIIKATAVALLRVPALNARFNAEKMEVTRYGDVNLGIAVAISDGLIVPVLRGVNQMNLRDIRVRSVDLIERARAETEARGADRIDLHHHEPRLQRHPRVLRDHQPPRGRHPGSRRRPTASGHRQWPVYRPNDCDAHAVGRSSRR